MTRTMHTLLRSLKTGCFGAALLAGAMVSAPAHAAEKEISIGVPHWSSANAMAHIIQAAFEKHTDYTVELKTMGTLGIISAMGRGDVDIHPQIWLPFYNAGLEKYPEIITSLKGVPAKQNLCVTSDVAKEHGIVSVDDLTDPKKAAIFDTDLDGRGEMWIGSETWATTPIEKIRARSYGFAEHFTLVEADEAVAMASVDASIAVQRPMVFVCYQPHHLFKLHDIVVLQEPKHDPDLWNILSPTEDERWFKNSSAAVGWKEAHFHVGYIESLANSDPDAARALDAVDFSVTDVHEMTYALHVERQDPAEFAQTWISDNADRVAQWFNQ